MPVHLQAAPANLYAQSAVLMDADSGRILFEKKGDEKRPMASTTKIMTCILALEQSDLMEQVEISEEAARQPKVHLGAAAGEHFYLKDLLYSLMLESHNDTAVAIAQHVGKSVQGFASLMNQKAKEIGCEDTYFITPNGLDAQDTNGIHETTAKDLAAIMRYCIFLSPKKDAFLEITRTSSYAFSNIEGNRSFSCVNHNAFLGMMEGALSGKTGFTGNAGYCYVGALRKDGKTLIVALLACGWPEHKNYKWSDTRRLMEYGLQEYDYRDVWEDLSFEKIPVKDGIPKSGGRNEQAYVTVGVEDTDPILLLLRPDETVSIEKRMALVLNAPVLKGSKAGVVRYLLDGKIIKELPVFVQETVQKISFRWCARKVFEKFLGVE